MSRCPMRQQRCTLTAKQRVPDPAASCCCLDCATRAANGRADMHAHSVKVRLREALHGYVSKVRVLT